MVFVASGIGLEKNFFEERIPLLPQEKRLWLLKVKNENAKSETTLAWLLLRHALKMKSGEEFPPLSFSERGKPGFEGSFVRFNLSHSGFVVCAAVSSSAEIGVDVQKKSLFSDNVKRRVFCASELENGKNQPDENLYFTRLWAIKESYLKQTGVGIAFDFKSLDFSSECLEDYFEKDGLCYTVREIEGFCFSVCTPEKGKQEFVSVPARSL